MNELLTGHLIELIAVASFALVGMALLCPDVGEVLLLTNLLGSGNNWTLKLFKNDITPAEGDTAGTYTVADFTNYVDKTLTRTVSGSTWATPTTTTGTTSSEYNSASPQSWTCGATGNTIYGYYIVDAIAGTLLIAERFAASRTLALNDTLNLTPKLELD